MHVTNDPGPHLVATPSVVPPYPMSFRSNHAGPRPRRVLAYKINLGQSAVAGDAPLARTDSVGAA